MQDTPENSFANAELREIMASANAARAVELRRLFGLARTAIVNLFAARPTAAAVQN